MEISNILDCQIQFVEADSFVEQLSHSLQTISLKGEKWQTEPILVNLPGHNVITAILLAELHGRMGYFPPVIRWKTGTKIGGTPYEVAEILNLNKVRQNARTQR